MAQVQPAPGSMTGTGFGSGGGGDDPERNKYTKAGMGHYIDKHGFIQKMRLKAKTGLKSSIPKNTVSSLTRRDSFNAATAWNIIDSAPDQKRSKNLDTIISKYRSRQPNPRFEYFGNYNFAGINSYFESTVGHLFGEVADNPCDECAARASMNSNKQPIFGQCTRVRADPDNPNDSSYLWQGKCTSCVHQAQTCSFKPQTPKKNNPQQSTIDSRVASQSPTPVSRPGQGQALSVSSSQGSQIRSSMNPSNQGSGSRPSSSRASIQPFNPLARTAIAYSRSDQLRLPSNTQNDPDRTRALLNQALRDLDDPNKVVQGAPSTPGNSQRGSMSPAMGRSPNSIRSDTP